jgi:hypothetical protein
MYNIDYFGISGFNTCGSIVLGPNPTKHNNSGLKIDFFQKHIRLGHEVE